MLGTSVIASRHTRVPTRIMVPGAWDPETLYAGRVVGRKIYNMAAGEYIDRLRYRDTPTIDPDSTYATQRDVCRLVSTQAGGDISVSRD